MLKTVAWEGSLSYRSEGLIKEVREELGFVGAFTWEKKKTNNRENNSRKTPNSTAHVIEHPKITSSHKNLDISS